MMYFNVHLLFATFRFSFKVCGFSIGSNYRKGPFLLKFCLNLKWIKSNFVRILGAKKGGKLEPQKESTSDEAKARSWRARAPQIVCSLARSPRLLLKSLGYFLAHQVFEATCHSSTAFALLVQSRSKRYPGNTLLLSIINFIWKKILKSKVSQCKFNVQMWQYLFKLFNIYGVTWE